MPDMDEEIMVDVMRDAGDEDDGARRTQFLADALERGMSEWEALTPRERFARLLDHLNPPALIEAAIQQWDRANAAETIDVHELRREILDAQSDVAALSIENGALWRELNLARGQA